jgi:NAD(P)-dependent dehydrogenase (short-subunit alcohol dehydrogenase family)
MSLCARHRADPRRRRKGDDEVTKVSLSRQAAVVTGGGKGLGRAHALELARLGASVVVNDFDDVAANEVVAEIRAAGGSAVGSSQSVATREGGQIIINTAVEAFGTIDIVVNNAGFLRNAYFEDMTVRELDEVLDVHLRGAFFVTQPAWRIMLAKRYGRIVFTASGAGLFGGEASANYGAAKAGLYGLCRCLAIEGAEHGILVNCLLPAAKTTIGQTSPMPDRYRVNQANRVASRRVTDARRRSELVSPLVGFLCSPLCQVTGRAYSSALGRYARAFAAVAEGWMTTTDDVPSASEIGEHFDEIDSLDGYTLPGSVYEEMSAVAEKVRERSPQEGLR